MPPPPRRRAFVRLAPPPSPAPSAPSRSSHTLHHATSPRSVPAELKASVDIQVAAIAQTSDAIHYGERPPPSFAANEGHRFSRVPLTYSLLPSPLATTVPSRDAIAEHIREALGLFLTLTLLKVYPQPPRTVDGRRVVMSTRFGSAATMRMIVILLILATLCQRTTSHNPPNPTLPTRQPMHS